MKGRKPEEEEAQTHLKHVGHDGSSALDVNVAGAIVVSDRRLDGGRCLRLSGALRDKVVDPVWRIEAEACRRDDALTSALGVRKRPWRYHS